MVRNGSLKGTAGGVGMGGWWFRWDIGRAREQRFRHSPMYARPAIAPDLHELV